MPCLNEADTLGTCMRKAQRAFAEHGIAGEVIVADNGSTDGSQAIARRLGARVVARRGAWIRQRADGRHRRSARAVRAHGRRRRQLRLPRAAEVRRQAARGIRSRAGLPAAAGGGTVMPGAMPFLHRWWAIRCSRCWRGAGSTRRSTMSTAACAGSPRSSRQRLEQRCTGMEFATEMIIKSSLLGAHRRGADHAASRRPQVRMRRTCARFATAGGRCASSCCTARAGCSSCPALAARAARHGRLRAGAARRCTFGLTFDVHTLLFASLASAVGYQSVLFAVFDEGLRDQRRADATRSQDSRLGRVLTLERALVGAAAAILVGVVLLVLAVNEWRAADFGDLDYADTMRLVVPGFWPSRSVPDIACCVLRQRHEDAPYLTRRHAGRG